MFGNKQLALLVFVGIAFTAPTIKASLIQEFGDEPKVNLPCHICEWVVDEVRGLIVGNKTTEEIVHSCQKTCALFPHHEKQCWEKINRIVIRAINTPTQAVCARFHLCPKQEKPNEIDMLLLDIAINIVPAIMVAPKENIACHICEYGTDSLRGLIMGKKSVEEIVKDCQKTCKLFPHHKEQCNSKIEKIVTRALTTSSEAICARFKICPKENNPALLEETTDLCNVIKTNLLALQRAVSDDNNLKKIYEAIKSSCEKLPLISEQCTETVQGMLKKAVAYFIHLNIPNILKQYGIC